MKVFLIRCLLFIIFHQVEILLAETFLIATGAAFLYFLSGDIPYLDFAGICLACYVFSSSVMLLKATFDDVIDQMQEKTAERFIHTYILKTAPPSMDPSFSCGKPRKNHHLTIDCKKCRSREEYQQLSIMLLTEQANHLWRFPWEKVRLIKQEENC